MVAISQTYVSVLSLLHELTFLVIPCEANLDDMSIVIIIMNEYVSVWLFHMCKYLRQRRRLYFLCSFFVC